MKIIALLFCFFLNVYAVDIAQGKSVIVTFDNSSEDLHVKFQNKTFSPLINPKDPSQMFVILPIDYKAKIGQEKIEYIYNNEKKTLTIDIKEGNYKKEKLSVNPKKVNPPKELSDKIYQEYKEANAIYNTISEKTYWEKPFIYPLNSKITSEYGNARVFNDTLKSYHSGTDFRADIGTPVKAINDGKIVIASDRYYAGGSIVIDHGNGLYSCYFHLSEFFAKVGDVVKQADIIGLSGKSGRVTGPHLHFGIKLYNTSIDPLHFIAQVNDLISN
jgi:murein DD-endopeptidase MepM/ murein hydrolase activator NlpD